MLVLLLASATETGHVAALIGNDRVTATYPGFRRDPGDATVLAVDGVMRGPAVDTIVVRKVASLSSATEFTPEEARNIALSHLHGDSKEFETELSRTVLAAQRTAACARPAYGFVVKRKISIHYYDGTSQEWTQADIDVLELVGNDVWQAEYERTYEPDVGISIPSLIKFVGSFCVQRNYRGANPR